MNAFEAHRKEFNEAWEHLARQGRCDELGGAEYNRVFEEWCHRRYERPVGVFILMAANMPTASIEPVPHEDSHGGPITQEP